MAYLSTPAQITCISNIPRVHISAEMYVNVCVCSYQTTSKTSANTGELCTCFNITGRGLKLFFFLKKFLYHNTTSKVTSGNPKKRFIILSLSVPGPQVLKKKKNLSIYLSTFITGTLKRVRVSVQGSS